MQNPAKLSPREILPLLHNRNFLKLWGAQILGQTATNALHFTLVIQVFQATGNNLAVGILIAILSLPAVFISPLAGVLADSFNRRNLLAIFNGARLIVTLLILLFFELPAILLLLAFLVTTASQFFIPTEQSSIPDLVDPSQLMRANSFFTFSLYGSFLIGYTGAGPLFEYGGEFITLFIISGMFLAAALLNSTLPDLKQHLRGEKKSISARLGLRRIGREMLAGLKYTFSQKILVGIIIQVAFIFAVERAVIALVPAIAHEFFGFSVADISFFMITPLAVGTVVGTFVVNKLKYRFSLIKLITLGLIIDAVVLSLFPLYQEVLGFISQMFNLTLNHELVQKLYIITIAMLSGLADVMIIISAQTFIQKHISTEVRGRVFSSMIMSMNLLGVPLVLLISLLADLINIKATLIGFGFATVVVAGIGFVFYKRNKRFKIENFSDLA